jgi:excisionase family DNA binding protein
MAKPEGMITVQEAARRLGRSIEQVRRYLREGKLRGERIGQQWFIEEASLAARPVRYRVRKPRTSQIREVAAVMEAPRMTKREIEALIRRIDERREAIRKRVGTFDVVKLIREVREEH